MRRRLPPLNALKTFDAVGRWKSITLAAKELCVTEPAVSRAIKSLEEHFDVPLFNRLPRGLELTEHGKALLPGITEALDNIADSSRRIYQHKKHHLSLLTTPHIAAYFLSPRLREFTSNHDDIDVYIHSSVMYNEVFRQDFDIAIWYGECSREGYERQFLFDRQRIPFCSRDYLEQIGEINEPADLLSCTLLHEFDYEDWAQWFRIAGIENHDSAHGLISDSFDSLRRAAIHGAGIALLFYPFLDDELTMHNLIAPVGYDIGLDTEYSIMYRTNRQTNPAIENFMEFIQDLVNLTDIESPTA